MHHGENLKKLIELDDRDVVEIARLIGRKRNTIYKLYNKEKIDDYYVNKLKAIGLNVTDGYTKDTLNDPPEIYKTTRKTEEGERADYVIIAVLEKQLREQIEQTKLLRIIAGGDKKVKAYEKTH